MRRLIVAMLIAVLAVTVSGANSYGQVSSAAVLFLRIAAGARAAGMGEAFVAVADDATATHWNPAGLGQYPLAGKWATVKIPDTLLPLRNLAPLEGENAETDYMKFDIWALSKKGLVKYVKDHWVPYDVIPAKASVTAESILRRYIGAVGDAEQERLDMLLERVAEVNNERPRESIDSLEMRVMAAVTGDYKEADDLQIAFDSLKAAYNRCLIDWEKYDDASSLARKSIEDSVLNETEADKILFALGKAKLNYLRADLKIPFSVNFKGRLNSVAAEGRYLWVASDSGLYRYDGNRWQRFGVEDGLPTAKVRSITLFKNKAFLGTDTGLVLYDAGAITHFGLEQGLPHRPIASVAVENAKKAWVVIDGDLYLYNGSIWKNYIEVKDTAGLDGETVYQHMKLFDTPSEKEGFLLKYKALNSGLLDLISSAAKRVTVDSVLNMIDSAGVMAALEKSQAAGGKALDSAVTLKIPFTAGLKFAVRDMEVDNYGNLWIGTEHGILQFNGRTWRQYGYRKYTADKDMDVFELALGRVRGDSTRAERLAANIRAVNELESDVITAGQSILVYANPAGARVNDIQRTGSKMIFATTSGAVYFDVMWARYNVRGLGNTNTYAVKVVGGNSWFLARDRIEISAGAKKEVALMHVNWLPELADDIYYEFLGYVQSVEGWGTVGVNVTFLSYGKIIRTSEQGVEEGEFSAFDIAFTLSYGTPLTSSLSGGISAKIIYSHLSTLGAGREKGSGTSTGLALDLGLLYKVDPRLTLGLAITNLGPDISYIDVSQADPLPRNLAFGIAWNMIQSSYNEVLFTIEANKSLAEREETILEDFKDVIASPQGELKGFLFNPFTTGNLAKAFEGVIVNGGIEYRYASFFALRAGYIHDEQGDVKTPTLGVGLAYSMFRFDFAYIPSNDEVPLANTMRFSLSLGW
jgi:hypothetical protein